MAEPPLGFLTVEERTPLQAALNQRIIQSMPRFAIPGAAPPPKGTKIMLSDFWGNDNVIKECGYDFSKKGHNRSPFHQLTGSCVGCGGGNALFTLIAVQRSLSQNPTQAILPFWLFNYGRSRALSGMRGKGEGSMGSAFAKTVTDEGVLSVKEPNLTEFQMTDGLTVTSSQEYDWSDGGSNFVKQHMEAAKKYPLGTAAPVRSVEDMRDAAVNGYPGTFACDNYIGNARVQGSGADAAVCGYWDGRGGHQQWFFGYWDNPSLGPLYAVGNNWPKQTYPADPGGLPLVCCWVTEKNVEQALRMHAEVFVFSHLNWFPAQPEVLNWRMAV